MNIFRNSSASNPNPIQSALDGSPPVLEVELVPSWLTNRDFVFNRTQLPKANLTRILSAFDTDSVWIQLKSDAETYLFGQLIRLTAPEVATTSPSVARGLFANIAVSVFVLLGTIVMLNWMVKEVNEDSIVQLHVPILIGRQLAIIHPHWGAQTSDHILQSKHPANRDLCKFSNTLIENKIALKKLRSWFAKRAWRLSGDCFKLRQEELGIMGEELGIMRQETTLKGVKQTWRFWNQLKFTQFIQNFSTSIICNRGQKGHIANKLLVLGQSKKSFVDETFAKNGVNSTGSIQ